MKKAGWAILLQAILIMVGCNDETREPKHPTELYFDYSITGQEGDDVVSCIFRYRKGGMDGEAVSIDAPGKVELDGTLLKPDSAGFSGIYYGLDVPMDSFAGRHTIVFTAPDGKVYKDEFEYRPFTLDDLPLQVRRQPFTLRIRDLPEQPVTMHLVMIDTAFANNDLNRKVKVEGGELKIDQEMLSGLSKGPVSLELSRETERRPRQRTMAGGRMFISYGLRRDFDLVD